MQQVQPPPTSCTGNTFKIQYIHFYTVECVWNVFFFFVPRQQDPQPPRIIYQFNTQLLLLPSPFSFPLLSSFFINISLDSLVVVLLKASSRHDNNKNKNKTLKLGPTGPVAAGQSRDKKKTKQKSKSDPNKEKLKIKMLNRKMCLLVCLYTMTASCIRDHHYSMPANQTKPTHVCERVGRVGGRICFVLGSWL